MTKPIKFEHIGLFVSDMDRSLKFYTEVIGLTFLERRAYGTSELAFVELGGQQLELIAGPDVPAGRSPIDHFGWTVTDLEGAKARIKSLYPEAEFETDLILWDGMRCTFFRGPDGERLELFERPNG